LGGQRGRLIPEHERSIAVVLIVEAIESGARKIKACEILSISTRTFNRWNSEYGLVDQRYSVDRVPANKLSADELNKILEITNSDEFSDLPPTQIVPMLADRNEYYASESTFYRILRAEKMLKHRHKSKPKQKEQPKQLIATGPNQVWSWDITYLKTTVAGIYFYLYMFIDIFSRKIVGWNIHRTESADHASNLIKHICLSEGVSQNQISLHSDNGSPMKGATMLMTLKELGVSVSFSRPSVSDDNPFSEALFKTVKYNRHPTGEPYDLIDKAFECIEVIVSWYNYEHKHSSIKFVTPEQRHNLFDKNILLKRDAVYKAAKERTPARWSGETRNWEYIKLVSLNPGRSKVIL
jgi:putative transposase